LIRHSQWKNNVGKWTFEVHHRNTGKEKVASDEK